MKAIMHNGKLLIDGVPAIIQLPSDIKQLLDNQTNKIHLTLSNGRLLYRSNYPESMQELRDYRDSKIAEIDYLFLSDSSYLTTTTDKTDLKALRKSLREITNNVLTFEEALEKINYVKNLKLK